MQLSVLQQELLFSSLRQKSWGCPTFNSDSPKPPGQKPSKYLKSDDAQQRYFLAQRESNLKIYIKKSEKRRKKNNLSWSSIAAYEKNIGNPMIALHHNMVESGD